MTIRIDDAFNVIKRDNCWETKIDSSIWVHSGSLEDAIKFFRAVQRDFDLKITINGEETNALRVVGLSQDQLTKVREASEAGLKELNLDPKVGDSVKLLKDWPGSLFTLKRGTIGEILMVSGLWCTVRMEFMDCTIEVSINLKDLQV
jgi:hypothetical protein